MSIEDTANSELMKVYESTNNQLLWDFKILQQTDNKIEHNKPDIVVLDKVERKRLIIDVACLFDILQWLAEISVTCHLKSLQRACLLGTARILRLTLTLTQSLKFLRSRAVT